MDTVSSIGKFDSKICQSLVDEYFSQSALPSLCQYIKIPNLSRIFDKQWSTNGLLDRAAEHIKKWVQQFGVDGLTTEIIKLQGLTPIIFTQINGDTEETLFFYGHYDKQPPFTGWSDGFGPFTPIIRNDRLYGRGGADDGYSTYGTMIAIKALQKQRIKIPRCVMITEGDEESSSGHIGAYIDKLKHRIGNPTIFFCLDSGVLDYQRLWVTNSLRGTISGKLRVEVLTQGVHSGDSSGVVPSAFRIMRNIIDRLENSKTGQVNQVFNVDVPPIRYQQMYELAKNKGQQAIKSFPFQQGVQRVHQNVLSTVIAYGWKPQLAIPGALGLPDSSSAGNVMLPFTQLTLSLRIPPTKNSKQAEKVLISLLTENPPYNAKVSAIDFLSATGFNAPQNSSQLEKAMNDASLTYFGQTKLSRCDGASIPVLGMFKEIWPKAQFVVTGVLGPFSNAHGPNQFLHIPYVKKLISCIAHIIAKK